MTSRTEDEVRQMAESVGARVHAEKLTPFNGGHWDISIRAPEGTTWDGTENEFVCASWLIALTKIRHCILKLKAPIPLETQSEHQEKNTSNISQKKMANKLTLKAFLERTTDESNSLPSMPTSDELGSIRKGLRKKTAPAISLLPEKFRYEDVGEFKKITIGCYFEFTWKLTSEKRKRWSYQALCMDPARELDRLEFGWMIANFARLDGLNYLSKLAPISWEDSHQNQFNRRYSTQQRHFQKIENDWRHWAVVPAGHMLFV